VARCSQLRQVFKQCGDEPQSTRWLLAFGPKSLTPATERSMQRLRLRFAEVPEANLLSLLRVFESVATVSAVLRGTREMTQEESFRVDQQVQRAEYALSHFAVGFKDELPREELQRLELWQQLGRRRADGASEAVQPVASGATSEGGATAPPAAAASIAPSSAPVSASACAPVAAPAAVREVADAPSDESTKVQPLAEGEAG
jgi:hypothetical protein